MKLRMGVSLSMKKRGYTHIDKIGTEIGQMIKEGKTERLRYSLDQR